jgi:hypothetical protein
MMPSKTHIEPAVPANNKTIGTHQSLLYSGSKFTGCQKSKGNSYDVEVVLQVNIFNQNLIIEILFLIGIFSKNVDIDNSYICGYLKIKGLTEGFIKDIFSFCYLM